MDLGFEAAEHILSSNSPCVKWEIETGVKTSEQCGRHSIRAAPVSV